MNIDLSTDRLRISPLSLSDLPFILALTNSKGWLKFIGDRKIHSEKEAIKYLEVGPLSSYKKYGFGLFKVSDKLTGEPLGMSGFLQRDHLSYPDHGFAFLPDYEGKGFAYESSSALLKWATIHIKQPKILGITLPENARSIHLLERLNFQKEGTVEQGDKELLVFAYHLL